MSPIHLKPTKRNIYTNLVEHLETFPSILTKSLSRSIVLYSGYENIIEGKIHISGGSRISPGGAPTPRGAPTYDFTKLHEMERIWVPGGGGASKLYIYNRESNEYFQSVN